MSILIDIKVNRLKSRMLKSVCSFLKISGKIRFNKQDVGLITTKYEKLLTIYFKNKFLL